MQIYGTIRGELAQMDIRAIRLEHVEKYVNRLEDMSASRSRNCC